jgi:3-methyladenine DNA glycosylase AlkD
MKSLLVELRAELKANSSTEKREASMRFFREPINPYGLTSGDVTRIGKDFYKTVKGRPKSEIFGICEELWKSGFLEETFIACQWSYSVHKDYTREDFKTFEHWVDSYINNWASCDTFCNHNVGDFVMMFPEYVRELKRWALSDNRWKKRAAAVSLIVPARKGLFLHDIFEIADILLTDSDDMVQKGYGWMLKSASQAYQKEIFDFVVSRKAVMPRTALRYAIEKMPPELKKKAMER